MDYKVLFLANCTVYIKGFDEESHKSLVHDCRIGGAEVIEDDNYDGTVDFLILPLRAITMDGINVKAKKIVNSHWMISAERLHLVADPTLEIPYFYEPIFFPKELRPLIHMVIVPSIYSEFERRFLFRLAEVMGAEAQESFVRANKPMLICPDATGTKYEAAIRWGLPVVRKNWLLDCYKLKKRIALRNYLVGDSKAPVDDVPVEDTPVDNAPANNSPADAS